MSVSCECCVLLGRGLCVGLITRPEESYRLWCVWVWSWSRDSVEALAHWGGGGRVAPRQKRYKACIVSLFILWLLIIWTASEQSMQLFIIRQPVLYQTATDTAVTARTFVRIFIPKERSAVVYGYVECAPRSIRRVNCEREGWKWKDVRCVCVCVCVHSNVLYGTSRLNLRPLQVGHPAPITDALQ
jgi:hypothetical protein